MTYEKHFVAIRHESEIMTPLIESPIMNFSLREMGYLGAFGLSAVFGAIGSVPIFLAVLTFPLFVLAFFRWHGEIPEMYLYFGVMSFFDPSGKSGKKAKVKRFKSDISGFGGVNGVTKEEPVAESGIQKVRFSDGTIPIDMTLDIGPSHTHETVTVLIDGTKVIRDSTNGAGLITISIMPQKGRKKFTVKDANSHTIISKTVEFDGGKRHGE